MELVRRRRTSKHVVRVVERGAGYPADGVGCARRRVGLVSPRGRQRWVVGEALTGGVHRVEAHRVLGRREIEVVVAAVEDLQSAEKVGIASSGWHQVKLHQVKFSSYCGRDHI